MDILLFFNVIDVMLYLHVELHRLYILYLLYLDLLINFKVFRIGGNNTIRWFLSYDCREAIFLCR
jgi:hypothetical protein